MSLLRNLKSQLAAEEEEVEAEVVAAGEGVDEEVPSLGGFRGRGRGNYS